MDFSLLGSVLFDGEVISGFYLKTHCKECK